MSTDLKPGDVLLSGGLLIRWFVQFDFKTEAHQVYPDLSI